MLRPLLLLALLLAALLPRATAAQYPFVVGYSPGPLLVASTAVDCRAGDETLRYLLTVAPARRGRITLAYSFDQRQPADARRITIDIPASRVGRTVREWRDGGAGCGARPLYLLEVPDARVR